jgi:hypothetical protein
MSKLDPSLRLLLMNIPFRGEREGGRGQGAGERERPRDFPVPRPLPPAPLFLLTGSRPTAVHRIDTRATGAVPVLRMTKKGALTRPFLISIMS